MKGGIGMLRKALIMSVVSLSIITLSNLAWTSVVGTWDVQGTEKVTVKIPGYGSDTETVKFYDEFTFHSNGQFEMIDMGGTWSQTGKKFTINLDPSDVEAFFEYYLGEYGFDVSVDVTGATFTGTEQKNGTIKGKITLNMNVYFYDLDVDGTIRVTANFSGTISAGGQTLSFEGDVSPQESGSLAGVMGRKVISFIQTHFPNALPVIDKK
jgi:hypothetical protein